MQRVPDSTSVEASIVEFRCQTTAECSVSAHQHQFPLDNTQQRINVICMQLT